MTWNRSHNLDRLLLEMCKKCHRGKGWQELQEIRKIANFDFCARADYSDVDGKLAIGPTSSSRIIGLKMGFLTRLTRLTRGL